MSISKNVELDIIKYYIKNRFCDNHEYDFKIKFPYHTQYENNKNILAKVVFEEKIFKNIILSMNISGIDNNKNIYNKTFYFFAYKYHHDLFDTMPILCFTDDGEIYSYDNCIFTYLGNMDKNHLNLIINNYLLGFNPVNISSDIYCFLLEDSLIEQNNYANISFILKIKDNEQIKYFLYFFCKKNMHENFGGKHFFVIQR